MPMTYESVLQNAGCVRTVAPLCKDLRNRKPIIGKLVVNLQLLIQISAILILNEYYVLTLAIVRISSS